MRRSYTSAQTKARDSIDLQKIADMETTINDNSEHNISEAQQMVTHSRELISQEIQVVQATVTILSQSLTAEIVAYHKIYLDQMLSSLDTKLQDPLRSLITLLPDRGQEIRGEHYTFVKNQRTVLMEVLVTLFSKQSVEQPPTVTSPTVTSRTVSHRGLQLEKLKIPNYDRDPTKLLLFKDKFKDLVSQASYDDSAQGHVLQGVVPKEAQDRIEHLKLASEMMSILDQMYGDPATSVGIIVNKLLNLKLLKSTEYEKVIELATVVEKYSTILLRLSTDAIQHIKYNINLLAHLVELLP